MQRWSMLMLAGFALACSKQEKGSDFEVDGVNVEVLEVGEGPPIEKGQVVEVTHTVRLPGGEPFDESHPDDPLLVELGGGSLLEGWEKSFANMRVGGRRRATIPPALAYGSKSPDAKVPPNSTLVVEFEVLGIKSD